MSNSISVDNLQNDKYPYKTSRYSSHSLILQLLARSKNIKQVLDVGCGRGHLSRVLSQKGYEVIGLDNDAQALKDAKHWCSKVVNANLGDEPLSFEKEQFDCILFADILEHLSDPLSFLRGLIPSLTPNGIIVISVPNVAHLYVRIMLLLGRWDYSDSGILDRSHLRFFTKKSLLEFLDEAGITVKNIKASAIPFERLSRKLPKIMVAFLETLDHFASTIFPGLFAFQWVVSGSKK